MQVTYCLAMPRSHCRIFGMIPVGDLWNLEFFGVSYLDGYQGACWFPSGVRQVVQVCAAGGEVCAFWFMQISSTNRPLWALWIYLLHVNPNCLMRLLRKRYFGRIPHASHPLSVCLPVTTHRLPVSVLHMASACLHTSVRVNSFLAPFCIYLWVTNLCCHCLDI